jgi:tetratricopeptide (TPR) repeat protein
MKLTLPVALSIGLAICQTPDCDTLKKCAEAHRTNPHSSLVHFRTAEIYFDQRNYQSAANEFREAFNGDMQPRWVEVWAHINLGKIFDITHQRERALNEYRQALRTKDNTRGALDEAKTYGETPYSSK